MNVSQAHFPEQSCGAGGCPTRAEAQLSCPNPMGEGEVREAPCGGGGWAVLSPSVYLSLRASPTWTRQELPLGGDRPTFCSEGGARSTDPGRGRGKRGSRWALQDDEELQRWDVGGRGPTRATSPQSLARDTPRALPVPTARAGGAGRGGDSPQVAELRNQVARPYLQFLKLSLHLVPLALATLQLAGHGAAVRGGGGCSRRAARRVASTPRLSVRRLPQSHQLFLRSRSHART